MNETCGFWNKSCTIPTRLDDRIALVTGADGGLGFHITTELARRGATVVMACLDIDEANKTKVRMLDMYGQSNPESTRIDLACPEMEQSIKPIKDEQLVIEYLDLASLATIRQFVQKFLAKYTQLHYLINNAGLVCPSYQTTSDGFEMTLGVCHLGHFLLTELLIPILKSSAPSRIVFTTSWSHTRGQLNQPDLLLDTSQFRSYRAYAQSKLANVIYARELSRRLVGTGISTASVNPGTVRTNIAKDLTGFIQKLSMFLLTPWMIRPWQGIQSILYAILSPSVESGGYYSNCALKEPSSIARDESIQIWLIQKSRELVKLSE